MDGVQNEAQSQVSAAQIKTLKDYQVIRRGCIMKIRGTLSDLEVYRSVYDVVS